MDLQNYQRELPSYAFDETNSPAMEHDIQAAIKGVIPKSWTYIPQTNTI